jgi:hypothetical protein
MSALEILLVRLMALDDGSPRRHSNNTVARRQGAEHFNAWVFTRLSKLLKQDCEAPPE